MDTFLLTLAGVLLATLMLWLAKEAWRYLRPSAPDVRLDISRDLEAAGQPPTPQHVVLAVELRLRNNGDRDLHNVAFGMQQKGGVPALFEGQTIRRLRATGYSKIQSR